jgi:hypothetical protein
MEDTSYRAGGYAEYAQNFEDVLVIPKARGYDD